LESRRDLAMTETAAQSGHRPRILLIEDDPDMAALVCESLAEAGYTVERAVRAEEGLLPQREAPFDAVVLDHRLPGMDGLEFLAWLRRWDPKTPVVFVTAFGSPELFARAASLGAAPLSKPFPMGELLKALGCLVGTARPRADVAWAPESIGGRPSASCHDGEPP
jgi:DNA-binding response OmpR family regulator